MSLARSHSLGSWVLMKEEDTFLQKEPKGWCKMLTMGTPEYGEEGIRTSLTQKVSQLKCIYINARSMGNKQEVLEPIVLSESNIVAITETWWDDSHSWSAVVDGNQLFK